MKPPFHYSTGLLLLGAVFLSATLSGCGQKGPLYLGSPPPARVKAVPAQNMSVPAKPEETAGEATDDGTDASDHSE